MLTATTPQRYHPALVVLHWLLAVLIIADLCVGFFILGNKPNTDPTKIGLLKSHLIVGAVVLVLMLVRAAVRLRTTPPMAANVTHPALNKLTELVHGGLYLLVFIMIGSGIAMSIMANLGPAVFGGAGPLPKDFENLTPHTAHVVTASLLALAIAGHAAAALYHQFIQRDSLFSRMWFGIN